MSDDRRRRIRGGSGLRAARRPGKAGEPNVLSNAATPNVLSSMAPPPSLGAPGLAGPTIQQRPANEVTTRTSTRTSTSTPTTAEGDGWLGGGQTAPQSRVRLSFSTLLFMGFLLLTAFRVLGEFLGDQAGGVGPTTAPVASGAPAGVVTFGTGAAGDCSVVGSAVTFSPGVEVWWSADMASEQGANADAIVIYFRDGEEFDREYVPPDPDYGAWSVLCGNEPISESSEGRYRVEVWDGDLAGVQSAGEYVVKR